MHWNGSVVFHWVHLTFLFIVTFLAAILPSSMLHTLLGDKGNKFDSSLTEVLRYPDIWNNLFLWHLGGTTSVQTLVMVTLYQSPATKILIYFETRRWYWWPRQVGVVLLFTVNFLELMSMFKRPPKENWVTEFFPPLRKNLSPNLGKHQIRPQIQRQIRPQIWGFPKFVPKFGDKFVPKFGESPNLSPNLGTNSSPNLVNPQICP